MWLRYTNQEGSKFLLETFSPVQFSHSAVCDSLRPHEPQHASPPCPSPTSRVYPNSCPLSSVMLSNHLILCFPLLLLPSIFPNIRVFSHELAICIRSTKSPSVLPVNIQDSFPLGLTGLISFQYKGFSRVFSNTTVQKHQFFGTHIHTWLLEKS